MPSREEFISEPIRPVTETMDTARMAMGEPGLPGQFIWRGKTYAIAEVLETWKETGPCSHGSGEKYVRKHWYKIRTSDDDLMKIYCSRGTGARGRTKPEWRLFTLILS